MLIFSDLSGSKLLGASTLLLSFGVTSAANAALVFSEDFNSFASSNLGTQDATGLVVGNQGAVPGWDGLGAGGIHGVDHTGAGDWALQLYNGFTSGGSTVGQQFLTSASGIAANDFGETYTVTFDLSATIYEHFSQGTSNASGVVVQILRANTTELYSTTFSPGAWSGAQVFASQSFQYVGDGSGSINLQFHSLNDGNNLISGVVDSIEINTSAVPLPATAWLFGSALIGLAGIKRKK